MDDVNIIYDIGLNGFKKCKFNNKYTINIHIYTWVYFNRNGVIPQICLNTETFVSALIEFDKVIRDGYKNVKN